MDRDYEKFRELDAELTLLARNIKVLSTVAWPHELADDFLAQWQAGTPKLPRPPPVDGSALAELVPALERLSRPAGDHPLARFISRTAESYLLAARLILHAGEPSYTEISAELYGLPQDTVSAGGLTNLGAADRLLTASEELANVIESEDEACFSAEQVQARMRKRFDAFFCDHSVEVRVDPTLSAKAAAGAKAVRLRSGARYSESDVRQLIHHEGFVHTATALNGRLQPHLSCLSLPAPRTTATQEGLATFAEFVTGNLDLARLRRLAMRIQAIQRALEGADFIEVFQYFLEAGDRPEESYHSTVRIFRGGEPRGGGAVFTKDVVYLYGLLRTKTFLLTALAKRKMPYARLLFTGRLTWGDAVELSPFFDSGLIAAPRYIPEWLAREACLAGTLALSNLTHRIPVEEVGLRDFAPRDHEPGTTRRWSVVRKPGLDLDELL